MFMDMIYVHHYFLFFITFVNCMKYSLCMFGESVIYDEDETEDKLEINFEEILRRRKLIEPHLLKIVEKQNDWIETYNFNFEGRQFPFRETAEPKISASEENLVNTDSLLNGKSGEYPEWESVNIKKDATENQHLNSGSGKQEILYSNVVKLPFTELKASSLDAEEPLYRNKIVDEFLSELINVEKFIHGEHFSQKVNKHEVTPCDSNKKQNGISISKLSINSEELSEAKIVDSLSSKFTRTEKDRTEHHHSTIDSNKREINSMKLVDSLSRENHINTKEFEKKYGDSYLSETSDRKKYIETSHLNSESNKIGILPINFEKSESVSKDELTHNFKGSQSYQKIKDASVPDITEMGKDKAESHLSSFDTENHKISFIDITNSESKAIFSTGTEELYQHKVVNSVSEPIGTEKGIEINPVISEDSKIEDFPNHLEKYKDTGLKHEFAINSEDVLANHKRVDSSISKFLKPEKGETYKHHLAVDTKHISFHHAHKSTELTDLKTEEVFRNKVEDCISSELTEKEKCKGTIYLISKSTEEKNFDKLDDVSNEKLPITSNKHLHKQKIVNSYISTLNKVKRNWKETNHLSIQETASDKISKPFRKFNRDKSGHDSSNSGQEAETVVAEILEQNQIVERQHFMRWVKMLLNKFVGLSFNDHISITFSFTADFLSDLKEFSSQNFDVATADELISILILNATVHQDYNLGSIYNTYASIGFYSFLCFIALMLLVCIMYFMILYHRRIMFIILCILWHAFKMYQEKVAEKHAILSGSSSLHCDSILSKESGIFAHFKELVRYNAYNDHCKKYFKALMVDPLSELSVLIVVMDFLSSAVCQVFHPISHTLNIFVKNLFSDLGFGEKIGLIILLIFILIFCIVSLLIYSKYKLNFPFFMGSVEPSSISLGSRVQDLNLEHIAEKESPSKGVLCKKYDVSVLCHKQNCSLQMQHEYDFEFEKSRKLVRRFSF